MVISDERYRLAALSLLNDVVSRMADHGLDQQADLARRLRDDASRPTPAGETPAVVARLDEAFPAPWKDGAHDPVWKALRVLAPALAWTQTAAYVADPPAPGFLDRYSHTTILGPPDVNGRSLNDDEAALGAVLLGPGVLYPPHQHPADEVYLPLGTAAWQHTHDDGWVIEAPWRLIHHRPGQPHAMRVDAGDPPVMLLYVWTGDVRTSATWC